MSNFNGRPTKAQTPLMVATETLRLNGVLTSVTIPAGAIARAFLHFPTRRLLVLLYMLKPYTDDSTYSAFARLKAKATASGVNGTWERLSLMQAAFADFGTTGEFAVAVYSYADGHIKLVPDLTTNPPLYSGTCEVDPLEVVKQLNQIVVTS